MKRKSRSLSIKKVLDLLKRKDIPSDEVVPWGVHAEGISFPSLEKITEDFAKENGLKIIQAVNYDLHKSSDASVGLENLCEYAGKILQFDKGLVILNCYFTNHGPDNLERTFGGGPVESYSANYTLSGKINKKEIQAFADINYSRQCEQKQKRAENPLQSKYFSWVPHGEFVRCIYRWDKERFWFLKPQDKK